MQPTLIMVGADKGGVGKTTVARLLMDFFARNDVKARAFDTEWPRGTLHRFYPDGCEIINIEDVAHQMKVLDTLETAPEKITIVDFKAGALGRTLDLFDRIGVFEAARAGDFDIAMFHVVGPAVASLNELQEVSSYMDGVDYIVVRNFINETNFFEWDEDTYRKYFAGLNNAHEMEVPKLNEMAYEAVDLHGVTFTDFVNNRKPNGEQADFSFTLRGYVRKWLADLDEELGKLALIQKIMAAAGGSGAGAAGKRGKQAAAE